MDEDPWFCGETTDSDDKNEKIQDDEDDDTNICCICGEEYFGYGHNPRPITNAGRCCNRCNHFVIQTRLRLMMEKEGGPPDYYLGYIFDGLTGLEES